jgi:hypothetical protein
VNAARDQATPPAAALSTPGGKASKARKTLGAPEAVKQAQKALSRYLARRWIPAPPKTEDGRACPSLPPSLASIKGPLRG